MLIDLVNFIYFQILSTFISSLILYARVLNYVCIFVERYVIIPYQHIMKYRNRI